MIGTIVGACAACQGPMLAPTDGGLEKLLKPVTTSPESVTLEVWEARVPLDKDADAEALWQQVDEQCLDAELRRRLLANGLRAGVLGGALPDELAAMLGLQGEMPKDDGARVITPDLATPKATRRVVQVNRREQRTIQASDLRPQADVLLSDGGSVRGESFKQVEGRYQLSAESRPGQRVAVRLVPELHHGELRNRYSGSDQGILLMTPSREREAFDNLTVSVELAAGEALVVGCLPQAHATLGGVLHRDAASGRRERKFILVRVLEAPPSEILAER